MPARDLCHEQSSRKACNLCYDFPAVLCSQDFEVSACILPACCKLPSVSHCTFVFELTDKQLHFRAAKYVPDPSFEGHHIRSRSKIY